MSAVILQSDRGVSLQQQIAGARGGIQNGSFNRRVFLSNTPGNTNGELFIDGDGISRLRFPPNTVVTITGTLFSNNFSTGVVVPTASVFDYTFTTNAAGVTTIVANVAAVGFTVTKQNVVVPGGTEDVILVTGSAPGANIQFTLDAQIGPQSAVSTFGTARQAASAATIQGGRY